MDEGYHRRLFGEMFYGFEKECWVDSRFMSSK